MPERTVMINVTLEFRNKIKILKKELTYQQFFDNLIDKKSAGVSTTPTQGKKSPSIPKQGGS